MPSYSDIGAVYARLTEQDKLTNQLEAVLRSGTNILGLFSMQATNGIRRFERY